MNIKKLLILSLLFAGVFFVAGCVDDEPPVRRTYYAPAYYPPAPYYGDPYYVYGGVNYYNRGGRYFYYRGNRAIYVGGLPGGGYYWHKGGPYHGNYNRGRYYRHY